MTALHPFWRSGGMKRRRGVGRAWLLAAAGLVGLALGWTAPAAGQMSRLQPTMFAAQPSLAAPVRLYFFNAEWSDVLAKLAEESGSTLVMDHAPRGKFTRLDRKKYDRGEAVRILNRELEPHGFNILEKGEFLVVFNLRDMRNEYRRPTLPVPQDRLMPDVAPPAAPTNRRGPDDIMARHRAMAAGAEPSREPRHRGAGIQPVQALSGPVENLPHAPESSRRRPAPDERAPERSEPAPSPQQTTAVIRVPLRQRTAVDVARTIYETFKPHAKLVESGPDGLPAFTVSDAAGARLVDYTVGIDADRHELVVEAADARARQIEQLIQTLDAVPVRPEGVVEIAPTRGDNHRIAAGLQTALNQLVAQNEPDVVPPAQAPAVPPPRRPRRPGEPVEPDEPPPPAVPGSPPVQLQLQGPVTVREVPGVGLVVTGNRADVDAVLDVIRVLELAGAGVVPDIHLLMLRHVNSEALAELLDTVYEELSEIRSPLAGEQRQSVRVVPVVKPNAILILAPAREMESVLELAEALDTPVDPQAEFEVFRLENAIAAQVVVAIDTFYEDREPLGTRVRAIADVRTNSVIVQARGADMEEVARLIRKMDLNTSGAVSRLRIFPLENATATELAAVIASAIQSVIRPPSLPTLPGGLAGAAGQAGEPPQALQDAKSAILEFLAVDGDTARLVRSGILSDIRVTADPGRNALIVSAPEQSMDLMAVLIAQLDQPTPLVAEIKVFTLSNSDATATVELLRDLFQSQAAAQPPGFGGPGGFPGQPTGALQLAGAEGAGAGLIPLRFSVDPRTNTIVAIGSAGALQIVEAILLRLDESDIRQRQNTVIKLKNSFAGDVALAINQFLTAQRDLLFADPNLIAGIEVLEREIIVVPEIVSNSLLISATPRYFEEIINLVMQLDQKPPEVVIQALLVEVDLNNTDELGVELGFQDQVLFGRSVPGTGGAVTPGFNFNNSPLGNLPFNPSEVGAQGLTDLGLERTNPELGFGGLVLSASSESVSVLIRALSAKRTVHVLSRPQIRTLDNQLAQIQVGQDVPVPTGVSGTGFTVSPNVELRSVGIILSVVPRISFDGTIVMEVVAQRSSLAAERVPIFTDITTGNTVTSPVFNNTVAQATISVPNGQTVILGGMISKTDDAFENKVPWLGDIPYLGYAFRYDGVRTRRTELLIFLTPRVIRHEMDSELIKRVEAERLHFIERDAEEIHGPLYSAPPPDWYLNRPMPATPELAPPLPHGHYFDESRIPTTEMSPYQEGPVVPLVPDGAGKATLVPPRMPLPHLGPALAPPPSPLPPLPAEPLD